MPIPRIQATEAVSKLLKGTATLGEQRTVAADLGMPDASKLCSPIWVEFSGTPPATPVIAEWVDLITVDSATTSGMYDLCVTRMDMPSLDLSDLPYMSGSFCIRGAPNLTSLDISGGTSAPNGVAVVDCPLLETLNLYGNFNLYQLNIDNCPNVKQLDVGSCGLSYMSMSSYANLENITVNNCLISYLGLDSAPKLLSVSASYCPNLSSVYLGNCPLLTSVDLSGSALSNLGVNGSTAMTSLTVQGTYLSALNVTGITALVYLYGANMSSLYDFSCGYNPALTYIDLSYCGFTEAGADTVLSLVLANAAANDIHNGTLLMAGATPGTQGNADMVTLTTTWGWYVDILPA